MSITQAHPYLIAKENPIQGLPQVFTATRSDAGPYPKKFLALIKPMQAEEMAYLNERLALLYNPGHPLLLPVEDIVHTEHNTTLIFPWFEGVTLDTLFQRPTRLSPSVLLWIIEQTLRALCFLHQATHPTTQKPYSHQALMPNNIWISKHGHVKLANLFFEEWQDFYHKLTRTLHYNSRSMELFSVFDGPSELDALVQKTDVYLVGTMLYQGLTGIPLIRRAPNTKELSMIREIPSSQTLRPELSPKIHRLLEYALSFDIASNTGHASELQRLLSDCLFPLSSTQLEPNVIQVVQQEQPQRLLR
ncbi:MAG: hypothetical protein AAGJ35_12820, partial [Myxococcota bacterium]